jgi:glycogen synthase
MRVFMTADTVGGVFTYAVELIRALEPFGVETVLATFGRLLNRAQREQLNDSGVVEVHESDHALEWMPNPWDDIEKSESWLRELVDASAPDCIHFNHFGHAGLEWKVPVLVVAHSCVWSWWQAVHGCAPGPEFGRYYNCVSRAIHGAGRVIAPSADMLANLIRDYGVPTQATVISNGIDLTAFAPRPKLPYVLTAGRLWDQAKNVQALEQIASELSWPVYVAGEAVEPRALAAEGGSMRTTCRPLGALDRPALARHLSRASIYALPARYEPFGLSVLEAAASGCALVLGSIRSLRENWLGAACFVDPEDSAGLRRTLERLIADPSEREHWSARARRRATELTSQHMAERYAQAYFGLTASAQRSGSVACAS